MKSIKIRNIAILIILLNIGFVYGQNPSGDKQYYNVDIKSPGVTDFIKYGNLSSISNTGGLDYEIPLISTSEKGVNPVEIKLKYDASGFRPAKRSGLVGLNWFLSMGGSITREVNGMPDDQTGTPNSGGAGQGQALRPTNGFIVGVRNKTHNALNTFNLLSTDVYNNAWNLDFYLYGSANNDTFSPNNYEGDPDMFSFNFNGISGKFFMGNDGLIKVITNQPEGLKVDISQMQNQPIAGGSSKPIFSLIVITDKDGNKYSFGGETKNLEYTVNGQYPIITTWHLYKIEYYNGRVTNFNFRDDSGLLNTFESVPDNIAVHAGFPEYNGNDSNLRDFCILSEYVNDERQIYDIGPNGDNGSASNSLSSTVLKIAILDQIIDDNFIISFSYSRQAHVFNTRNNNQVNYPINPLFGSFIDIKLDEIGLYTKNGNVTGDLIKKVTFGYSYLGGTIHSRMFLSTLTESGKPSYIFEYYPTGNLPMPITFGIDHWGFWNGKNDNTNKLVPYQNYQSNGDYSDCTNTGDPLCSSRNPNFAYTIKGILSKVIYPTGGYTRFEYEQNDYSKRLEIRSANNYIPALYDIVDKAGGIRIKRIVDSADGIKIINIKTYDYKNDIGASSGILLTWPRYTIHWVIPAGNTSADQTNIFIRSNPIGRHIMDNTILAYSQVTEITNGIGKKVTKFTDFVTNPDTNSSVFLDHAMGTSVIPKNLARNYMGYFLNDRSIERGKPISEKIFDSNNNLKQQVDYVYNTDSNRFDKWSAKFHLSGPSVQSNKLYYYQDYLTSKTTTDKRATGDLVSTESYTYVEGVQYNTLTTCQDVLNSNSNTTSVANENLQIQYSYPWDIYPSGTTLDNFKNANIIAPLSKSEYRNSLKISEQRTEYSKDNTTNNLLFPKDIYSAKFPNNYPMISNVGQLEKKFTFDLYDDKGNVNQYTLSDGISTSIIWGYNKSQPIAKIENCLYTTIPTATIIDLQNKSNTGTEPDLINAQSTLRALFPNSLVTTYTFKPLVGVSTITDSKGDTMYYSYDVNGRLINIKDKNGNVISENQYHYKN